MKKTNRTASRLGALALLGLTLGGCDLLGPGDDGGAGTLIATLVSPAGNEAAAVLELTGGVSLGTISPVDGEVFYQHYASSTRVVVVMDEPGEVQFEVRTEDVKQLPEATVIQVASGENGLRSTLSGYRVVFARKKDPSNNGSGGTP